MRGRELESEESWPMMSTFGVWSNFIGPGEQGPLAGDGRTAMPDRVTARRSWISRFAALALAALLLSALAPASAANAMTRNPHPGVYRWHPHAFRVKMPPGSHCYAGNCITSHPSVLSAVNSAREKRGWAPASAGSDFAAEACALDSSQCDGVQWGACGLTPLPGQQFTVSIGSAVANGSRGCVEAISFSSFVEPNKMRGRSTARPRVQPTHASIPNRASSSLRSGVRPTRSSRLSLLTVHGEHASLRTGFAGGNTQRVPDDSNRMDHRWDPTALG